MLCAVAAIDITRAGVRGRWRTGNHRYTETCATSDVVTAKSPAIAKQSVDVAINAPGYRPQIATIGLRVAAGPVPGHGADEAARTIGRVAIAGCGGSNGRRRVGGGGVASGIEGGHDIRVRGRRRHGSVREIRIGCRSNRRAVSDYPIPSRLY